MIAQSAEVFPRFLSATLDPQDLLHRGYHLSSKLRYETLSHSAVFAALLRMKVRSRPKGQSAVKLPPNSIAERPIAFAGNEYFEGA